MSACPVCGQPPRAVLRPQGGGNGAKFCSITCRNASHVASTAAWQKTPRGKFINQRDRAKQRGVAWAFSYEEWLLWWGDDLASRGVTKDDLCMARFNDEGPYAPDNCYKTTMSGNHKERNRLRYGT